MSITEHVVIRRAAVVGACLLLTASAIWGEVGTGATTAAGAEVTTEDAATRTAWSAEAERYVELQQDRAAEAAR